MRATSPLRVFVSYAHADRQALERLQAHLSPMEREGLVAPWSDRSIDPGISWEREISARIETAQLILLLVSADFIRSDYCYGIELRRALERHARGEAVVVPIVVRPTDWASAPFARLQVLPPEGKPVSSFDDPEEAWAAVAQQLRALIRGGGPWGISAPAASPDGAEPTYDDPGDAALGEQLRSAFERRERQVEEGQPTDATDRLIRSLQRQLRRGPNLRPGDFLGDGRFRLNRLLGKGGLATVWQAYDRVLRQRVAVKVLHGHLAEDRTCREKFFAGARCMLDLGHPAVPRILEPEGEEDGRHFFVMDLLQGGDLRQAVLDGRLSYDGLVRILSRVADALRHAHARGLVHRDVKPENVLLNEAGEPFLSDFDLALFAGESRLTGHPALGGLVYTAPEVLHPAARIDHRADIFSLGMTLLFGLRGEELPVQALRDTHAFVDALSCPESAKLAVLVATAWDPDDRFADVDEMMAALEGEATAVRIGAATALRRAERLEREREEHYQRLFDHAGLGLYRMAPDGRLLMANETLARLLGYTGKAELFDPKATGPPFKPAFAGGPLRQRLDREGEVLGVEIRRQLPDGQRVRLRENARVVRGEGGAPVYYVGSIEPVAEPPPLDEQRIQAQKMESLGQLAAGIAHDFNNLLTAISGYSELTLIRLGEDHPQAQNVGEIKRAAERAAELTHQLLAFSRRQYTERELLDLNGVVQEIHRLLLRLIGEDVELRLEIPDSPSWIEGDRAQLEQVIVNLAVNARDAMPQGGSLTIRVCRTEAPEAPADAAELTPGGQVTLAVADTGEGMSEEVRRKVFEPFFSTKQGGTGLGLATVYGIVSQHGGEIECRSQLGAGTEFRIHLPAQPGPEPPVEEESRDPAALEVATVLVTEDEESLRSLLHTVLEDQGHTVLCAASGEEALERWHQHDGTIDLLVTDVVMPGLDGVELTRRLYREQPDLRVLFISGYVERERAAPPDVGTAFLAKPFAPQDLLRRVRDLLAGATPSEKSGGGNR